MASESSFSSRPEAASQDNRTIEPSETDDAIGCEETRALERDAVEPAATNASAKSGGDRRDGEVVSSTATLELVDDVTMVAAQATANHPVIPNDPDALAPGATFGQFEIKRYIGGGGMGRVYEGVDRVLERKVAIKVLPRRRAKDEATVARFLNEAKSAARLNHENIAQVYLFGNVDGVPYIAFEYVEGVNLRDYVLDRGVLELNEAIDFVLQVADALAHAAAHGVTHRDVKPSNIIVTPQKRVKLIDMGLARLLKSKVDDDLTESGVTLGTFDYISPEQARDPRQADTRSDVYSLGCTFYFMLVGAPPFPEGTMLQKLLMHQGVEAPDVRESNAAIPVEVAAVIKKMMRKDPAERYQTPEALVADLRQVVDMLGLTVAVQLDADPRVRARFSTAILRAAPAVMVVAVLLVITAVLYYGGDRHDVVVPNIEYSPFAPKTLEEERKTQVADSGAKPNGGGEAPGESALANRQDPNFATEENGVIFRERNEELDVGAHYEAAELDALYASAYAIRRQTNGDRTSDSSADEREPPVRLAAKLTVADETRDAFGWRAHALEPEISNFNVTSLTDDANRLNSIVVNWRPEPIDPQDATTNPASVEAVRVVDGRGASANSYATLQGALAAPSRDPGGQIRVELRVNDRLETPAISLVDKKVEIFAADGFRPILTFKQPETSTGGWSERMFLLDSTDLTLRGVDIDFTVPSQEVVASEWSLFEALGASSLTATDVTLTICNMTGSTYTAPLHSNVAFFRAKSSTTDERREATDANAFSASLTRVFARGEATVFDVEATCRAIETTDSGFVVSGSFLHYTQSGWNSETSAPSFTLRIEKSIAMCRSSFLRVDLDTESGGRSFFDATATRSILRANEQPYVTVYEPSSSHESSSDGLWENSCSFSQVALLDVATFLRVRGARSEVARELPLPNDLGDFECAKLGEMNADAYRRLESLPPHLFSAADFSNWILNPIHTASSARALTKELADEINRDFINFLRD